MGAIVNANPAQVVDLREQLRGILHGTAHDACNKVQPVVTNVLTTAVVNGPKATTDVACAPVKRIATTVSAPSKAAKIHQKIDGCTQRSSDTIAQTCQPKVQPCVNNVFANIRANIHANIDYYVNRYLYLRLNG